MGEIEMATCFDFNKRIPEKVGLQGRHVMIMLKWIVMQQVEVCRLR